MEFVLLYVIPFIIGWIGVRWRAKNNMTTMPEMLDVMFVLTPVANIIVALIVIDEFIHTKAKNFPQKFFRL
ncbi:Uncharacterised protein [[Flavobacterium] thermophilum]|nr:Uncharacterised protein [[Flavobacterium] thermophilum]